MTALINTPREPINPFRALNNYNFRLNALLTSSICCIVFAVIILYYVDIQAAFCIEWNSLLQNLLPFVHFSLRTYFTVWM